MSSTFDNSIPVLTEVLKTEAPGEDPLPGATAPLAPTKAEIAAALEAEAVDGWTDAEWAMMEHRLAERIMHKLQSRVDFVLEQRIKDLHEFNPMLGHRGCRLAITYPEIYAMQFRAILEAAVSLNKEGEAVHPEIMIPLAMTNEELVRMRTLLDKVAEDVFAKGEKVTFSFGTMIELPRAAVRAAELAQTAEFFSFGTNDLTQCTMGLSRDDAGKFLPTYVETGILPKDPFVTIDVDGVGALVRLAAERGRAAKAGLKLGVCGEHGGDPESIRFFRDVKLDYVSCSPFRVTIARLAAAQAEVQHRKGQKAPASQASLTGK